MSVCWSPECFILLATIYAKWDLIYLALIPAAATCDFSLAE